MLSGKAFSTWRVLSLLLSIAIIIGIPVVRAQSPYTDGDVSVAYVTSRDADYIDDARPSTTASAPATESRKENTTTARQLTTSQQQPSPVVASTFIPVAPCRILDSRLPANSNGVFGGPSLTSNSSRDINVAASSCSIPSNATAYSLNLTVVPSGSLGYVTLWPTGQARPFVSTLNSLDGRIVANAAIVPAGTNGSVSIFATDPTDFVIDINGYFSAETSGLSLTPLRPCRAIDTRYLYGVAGGPLTFAAPSRDFPLANIGCVLNAPVYVVNATVIPSGSLNFLTLSPTGTQRPVVSTLNSLTGDIVANMAIVSIGTDHSINAYASLGTNMSTDVVLDVLGFFSTGGSGKFYALPPCRVADTRGGLDGPNGIPSIKQGDTRIIYIRYGLCGVDANATAVSLNVTAVPHGPLNYLSVSPAFSPPVPTTSTLNSADGRIVANAAIVPLGDGSIQIQIAGAPTDVVIDVNGYFAP